LRSAINYDILSENRIRSALKTDSMAQNIHAFWSVGSTNEFALRMAQLGDPEGTLVIAEKQEHGRGRMLRSWDSPLAKGLWFSVILRPQLSSSQAGLLPYIAGVSVAEAVEAQLGLHPDLKWPNDLLVGGKKFCGILSEVEFENGKIKFIVLGIGVNVNHLAGDFSRQIRDGATSLRLAAETRIDRADLLAAILSKLEQNYERVKTEGFDDLLHRWKTRCSNFKKNVALKQDQTTIEGTFVDIDHEGCLLLKTGSGETKKISAGDVIFESGRGK